jgi:multidrug efflux pump subunit AcrA (membrane-fusion protein)
MVLRVRDDRVDVRKVELGRTRGGSREVLGGLEPGQAVALHPRALRPSDRVRAPKPKG